MGSIKTCITPNEQFAHTTVTPTYEWADNIFNFNQVTLMWMGIGSRTLVGQTLTMIQTEEVRVCE